jgi:hypothetical protein
MQESNVVMTKPTHDQIAVKAFGLYEEWKREAARLEMSYPGPEYFWFLAEAQLSEE